MNVDWRNRWGRNYVTSVRDQGYTENCWAFAMTALYESMIRVEHSLWTRRSEGEASRGTGKQSWDIGNLGEAHIFVERYGLADPDCFPWTPAAALYTAKPHGAALTAFPISPAPDRSGRTMKIRPNTLVSVADVQQKRTWLDLVGPMAVMLRIPADFTAVGSQVYTPATPAMDGVHALLVVGFNDDDQCWIVKNSWGTTWGDGGIGRISYAAGLFEPATFVGVRGTNPDPWSKRRQRTGSLVQGGNGARNNNFELFVLVVGGAIEHWYRENATASIPWMPVGAITSADPWRPLPQDAIDCPAVVQSSFNRNFELVYRCSERRLHHAYFDQASGWWYDARLTGPYAPVGIPGFVQSNRGAPGDFEVVSVNGAGQAEHWTKHNGGPWTRPPGEWYRKEVFGRDFRFSGPSLVQSRLGVAGSPENERGELHYVGAGADGRMHHYRRVPGGTWTLLSSFGAGITSGPALIEGTYGAGNEAGVGNFELTVTVGDRVQHWWRHNATLGPWVMSAQFGDGVARVVGLLQGTFGTNLELVVQRTDGHYQHYWRDGVGWHTGPTIV